MDTTKFTQKTRCKWQEIQYENKLAILFGDVHTDMAVWNGEITSRALSMSMSMVLVGQLVQLGILLPAVNQWCLGQFFIEKYHVELESSYR